MRLFILVLATLYLTMVVFVEAGRDFYKILGVDRDADKREIKKAYKVLSKKYHPDKTGGDTDKFVELSDAYETLIDDDKRRIYNQYGEEGLQNGQGQGHHNPFDIFNMFFNRGNNQPQERKGPNYELALEVTLEDLYNGQTIDADVSKQVLCDHCNGSGADKASDVTTCPVCNGRGVKVVRQQLAPGMIQTMQVSCDKCGGKGKIIKSTCPVCKGRKVRRGNEQLSIDIEPGMRDGEKIVFENEADESPDWVPGDIVFHIHTQQHHLFTRREDNLYMKETITLIEALAGFKREFKHLDGRVVELKRDSVTQPGYVQEVKNEGMPILHKNGAKGSLYVEYQVVFPTKVEEPFLEALKKGAVFSPNKHIDL